MTSSKLTVVVLVATALAGCSSQAQTDSTPTAHKAAPSAPVEATIGARHATIPIEGMACDSCAERLQQQLTEIDGVLEAAVDFEHKEARVEFDPTKLPVATLVAEIDKTFTAGEPRKGGEG